MTESIEEQVDYLTVVVSGIEAQVARTGLLSEAFGIVHGILYDLVRANELDMSEYADDLDRLDQLKHLML